MAKHSTIEGERQPCLAEDTNAGDRVQQSVFERETGLSWQPPDLGTNDRHGKVPMTKYD
jgi:hypothetical protein